MKVQSKGLALGLLLIVVITIFAVSMGTDLKPVDIGVNQEKVEEGKKIVTDQINDNLGTQESMETNKENSTKSLQDEKTRQTGEADLAKEKPPLDKGSNKSSASNEPSPDMSMIDGEDYRVKNGDTLFYIAKRTKLTINELKSINNLSGDTIYVGQVLKTQRPANSAKIAEAVNQSPTRGTQREDEVYWLSRVIHAEAQGESYQGKLAVGNVIMNRVTSHKFPNTLYQVIFDKQNGHTQFSPVLDGSIYNTPDKDSIRAANDVLNGSRPVGEALYFLNPKKSTNFWITANRKYMKTIGQHDFYY